MPGKPYCLMVLQGDHGLPSGAYSAAGLSVLEAMTLSLDRVIEST